MASPKIQVSKLDAARRQLETAVRLYFAEADPISIHTLTSAAYQLLADINRRIGGAPMLREQIPTWVRSDATAEARRKLAEAENFFKHADRDPESVLEFNPNATWLSLYDGCRKYQELANESVPLLVAFDLWCWVGPGRDLVSGPERAAARQAMEAVLPSPDGGRASFLAEVLPITTMFDS